MRRSTWFAVVAACVLLVGAGSLPRLPVGDAASAWRDGAARAVARWPVLSRRPQAPRTASVRAAAPATRVPAVAPRLLPRRLEWPAFAPPAVPVALALAVALVALALVFAAFRLRGGRRGHVFRLARRGRPTAGIARAARLPQDAVRAMLTPGVGAPRR